MHKIKWLFVVCIALVIILLTFSIFQRRTINMLTFDLKGVKSNLSVADEQLEYYRAKYKEAQSLADDLTEYYSALTNELTTAREMLIAAQDELSRATVVIESFDGTAYKVNMTVSDKELDMIAKTVWGEARGCSILEQSAVVWCILNRVDSGRGTIAQVITAYEQFHGYSSNNPVTEKQLAIAKDVVARWLLEKYTYGDVGRTLPKEYLYFKSDSTGLGNIFRTEWTGDYEVWDWNCWNPYE
jgi:hypothetical protein